VLAPELEQGYTRVRKVRKQKRMLQGKVPPLPILECHAVSGYRRNYYLEMFFYYWLLWLCCEDFYLFR